MSFHDEIQFLCGSVPRTDNSYNGGFRSGEANELIVSDNHARFAEMAARGWTYSVFTALAGTTVVAGNVAPPAAAAATVLTVLNPVGSGLYLEIISGWLRFASGTGAAGVWAWCGATPNNSITAAEATAIKRPLFVGQATPMFKAWSQAALTGGTVHTNVRPFAGKTFAAVIAATTWGLTAVDDVDGALIVPPGAMLTLAPAAVGTSVVVGAGINLAQVPLPEF